MAEHVSTWQAEARRKWLALEADKAAASGQYKVIEDRLRELRGLRADVASHLKSMELSSVVGSELDCFIHEKRLGEQYQKLASLDEYIGEMSAQFLQIQAKVAPVFGLCNGARNMLENLNIISRCEVFE